MTDVLLTIHSALVYHEIANIVFKCIWRHPTQTLETLTTYAKGHGSAAKVYEVLCIFRLCWYTNAPTLRCSDESFLRFQTWEPRYPFIIPGSPGNHPAGIGWDTFCDTTGRLLVLNTKGLVVLANDLHGPQFQSVDFNPLIFDTQRISSSVDLDWSENSFWLQPQSGWWFGTFFIFPYIGNNHPNWLIFFRGVESTNQPINHHFWPQHQALKNR